MKETNKQTLREAIDKLRVYQAPTHIWTKISAKLELGNLPQYKAPDGVWADIERQISTTKVKPFHAYWAIAASVLMLIAFGFLIPGEEISKEGNTFITLERELKGTPELTPAIRSTYETQFIALEKQLSNCLMAMSQEESRKVRPKLAEYYALASRHDELLHSNTSGPKNDESYQQLIKIGQKRKEVIQEIIQNGCAQKLPSK